MPIPELTHLQFAILGYLIGSEKAGREIREMLNQEGAQKSGPAFYQLMSRLEDAKLVKGRYEQKTVEGVVIKERRYEITTQGMSAWQLTRDFYFEQSAMKLSLGGLAGV